MNFGALGFPRNRRPDAGPVLTGMQPGGRICALSATPLVNADFVAASTLYLTPYETDMVALWQGRGSSGLWTPRRFIERPLGLVSAHSADGIFDVFQFFHRGAVLTGTGPAWATPTPGSCARGTGPGTTEYEVWQGREVNKWPITVRNGSELFHVDARHGRYRGSIFIDGTAGQVSGHVTSGQNRKWAIWNAHHRKLIALSVSDPTGTWTYNSGTTRASNNTPSSYSASYWNGTATAVNGLSTFCGLPEEDVHCHMFQHAQVLDTDVSEIAIRIGLNSTTSGGGSYVTVAGSGNILVVAPAIAERDIVKSLGVNNVCALEAIPNTASTNAPILAGGTRMKLHAEWLG